MDTFRNSKLATLALSILALSLLVNPGVIAAQAQLTDQETTQTNDYAAASYSDSAVVGSKSNKKTPPPVVEGAWCGSMSDNHLGSGTISLTINQKGSRLAGTWTADLAGSGTLKGKITGGTVTLTLSSAANECRAAVNGTLVEPGEITSNYSIFGCQQSDGGTFDITSPDC